jgi:ribosomal protein S18 acetylase RimI-like enzyme
VDRAGDTAATGIDDANIAMFDRMMVEFYTEARRREWADIKIDDDVIWGATGIPGAAFNGATAATFSEESADARIETILDYFRSLRIDMSWWVGPTSTPGDLGDRLAAHGLVPDGVAPGMLMSLAGWSPPPLPDGLSIEPTTTAAAFHEAMDVMFEAFEMPREVQPTFEARFIGFSIGPRAIQTTYLARLHGRAIATSLGLVIDDTVAIFNVATATDARRRGAGGAVTAAAMAAAQAKGARWAHLESSEMGRSVYERLGFRHVTDIAIYAGHFSGAPDASSGADPAV